ncbi:DUF7447 family protein [Bacillus thuringiensis]|uniref:DUF7447 family protein n=1 Tax=Bacillus thuringiensis TaxID=1428 RepID=UPI000BF5E147|nr:hypothetical protein [Bacillus thuringiensis]PFD30331.1 hypothetical protein CN278_25540 [Bacillus thuringiensis]
MKKFTLAEIKSAVKAKGSHWFDIDTMRYHGTQIVSVPNMANIFIAESNINFEGDKGYYLHHFDAETDRIATLNDYQHYETIAAAREARKAYTEELIKGI